MDETLLEDFCKAMTMTGTGFWKEPPNFRVWAIGHFLETAQHPVATALDKIVNAWLALKIGLTVEKADELWFMVYLGTRLKILSAFLNPKTAHRAGVDELVALHENKNAPLSTNEAAGWINKVTHRCFGSLEGRPKEVEATLFEQLGSPGGVGVQLQAVYDAFRDGKNGVQVSDAECASFVFARLNIFKHIILIEPKRLGLAQYVVECALTARALSFVAKLWRDLVDDEQRADKNPADAG